MKKKISALICGALMAFGSIAMASVSSDEVMLGDIQPGDPISAVRNIYGEPLQIVGEKWIYKGFYIEIDDDRPGYVDEIATRDPGFATQAGVIVSMSESALNENYGRADRTDYDDGNVEYTYYSRDGRYKMQFDVRNGIIIKIACEVR